VALHRSSDPLVGLVRAFDQVAAGPPSEQHHQNGDHQRRADELGERELPAEQDDHDDPELDDEIR